MPPSGIAATAASRPANRDLRSSDGVRGRRTGTARSPHPLVRPAYRARRRTLRTDVPFEAGASWLSGSGNRTTRSPDLLPERAGREPVRRGWAPVRRGQLAGRLPRLSRFRVIGVAVRVHSRQGDDQAASTLFVVLATHNATHGAVWCSEVHGAVALSPEPHRAKNLDPRRFQFGLRLLNVVDEELGHGAGRYMCLRLQARPPQLDLIPIRELEPNEVVRLLREWKSHHVGKEAAITSVSAVRTPRNTSPCAFTRSSSSGCKQPHDDTAVTMPSVIGVAVRVHSHKGRRHRSGVP